MEIFISYRKSARTAEMEFLEFLQELENRRHSSIANAGADGWSRMIPGLVCDLSPEVSDEKFPAMFIGLLNDEYLVSCELKEPSTSRINLPMSRPLNEGNLSYETYPDSINFLSTIADDSLSVQSIPQNIALPLSYAWGGINPKPVPTTQGDNATIAPILELAQRLTNSPTPNNHLTDLLMFLLHPSQGFDSSSDLRRLTREHNCRFAWSSIQFDHFADDQPPLVHALSKYRSPENFERPDVTNIRPPNYLREGRSALTGIFSFSPLRYSSLMEGRRPSAWPSWLQFLIFISKAGRRASSKTRARVPKIFGIRSRITRKIARRTREGGGSGPYNAASLKTLAQLFRGCEGLLPPAGDELRQRTRRLVQQKGLLLRIERSLIVPGTDTIYSLFRGNGVPVRATMRKSRGNK